MNIVEYRLLVKRAKKKRGMGDSRSRESKSNNGGAKFLCSTSTSTKQQLRQKTKGPNATEAAFNRDILKSCGVFEAMSFKIAGGHRYTPDFIVQTTSGIEAYEVKGSYRFPSEGRARLAFDDAAERYPTIKFYWYRKTKDGWKNET